MPDSTSFCPSAAGLEVVQLAMEGDRVVITAAARRPTVQCPVCGRRCVRVHSRYQRTSDRTRSREGRMSRSSAGANGS